MFFDFFAYYNFFLFLKKAIDKIYHVCYNNTRRRR